ncbi:MAG: helix-turn-helix transcriptional regulator [Oscillospiraceae bacterium]|nr:helix-turn-helix transcriptional regulator [Oscillospiraceae bacterium]MBQ7130326.1 helix-turn-helix transcriptional regulator [Oscillospiraceae bacterium]
MRDIGKNIKLLRIQQNMTQEGLAEKLFVTRQTVSNYETGRSRPDVEMLARIAEVLDTDANTVLYGPPAEISKKQEYVKTAICVVILVFLALPLPWLDRTTAELQTFYFVIWPRYLLTYWYTPILLLVLGWAAMQILFLFSKPAPLPRIKTVWLLRGCMMFILFYAVMMACVMLPFTKPTWLIYVYYFIMGVWPKDFSISWSYLFFPIGALLRFCNFPTIKWKNDLV